MEKEITERQFLAVVGDRQTVVCRYQNPQGVLGKSNQFRNPASYYEYYEAGGGVTVFRHPARTSSSGEKAYLGYKEKVRCVVKMGEEPAFLQMDRTKGYYVSSPEEEEKKLAWRRAREAVEAVLAAAEPVEVSA